MIGLGRYLLRGREPAISSRVRELVIQRVCAHLGCSYEWGVHVAGFASANNIDVAQVALLASGADADDRFSELERRVLAVVDSLLRNGSVEDAEWERASEYYEDEGLLELTVLVGWYHVISFVANALRVEPESWAPSLSQCSEGLDLAPILDTYGEVILGKEHQDGETKILLRRIQTRSGPASADAR